MTDILSDYIQRISTYSAEKLNREKKQQHLPLLRLVFFIVFAFAVYKYLGLQLGWVGFLAIVILIIFIGISFIDFRLKMSIKRYEFLIHINQSEVTALEGSGISFDSGSEFTDQSHDYTHDLDIFGQGSLFQYINRTATIFGKQRLSDYLSNAFGYSSQVVPRQQATKELADMVGFRQQLRLIFHEESITESDKTEITQWAEGESPVTNLRLLRILAYGLPAITMGCLVLALTHFMAFPVSLIILQLAIVFLYGRQTIKVQNSITSKSKILNKYAQYLQMIEHTEFKSGFLAGLRYQLTSDQDLSPSKSIHRLSTILKYMDSNLNILVAVVLNGLFMFNLHLLLKAEKWRKQNRSGINGWFESIATVDALSSLANFAHNNPTYSYPSLAAGDFCFEAGQLGHPLIPAEQRVVNDVEIRGWNQFYIITGANMSGKSTFLRTIGVNYILAMAGAPVCADRMIFHPVQIHSSIRTSDSLTRHESYFYAELRRLKEIIDELESGKKKLILLDEILKGTNSKDKQAGSIALIEQLLHYQSVGLFATHDLALGELEQRYPANVNNLCFEIEISGDQMVIDYKLHKGVCKNLNATYLMKNMGILLNA